MKRIIIFFLLIGEVTSAQTSTLWGLTRYGGDTTISGGLGGGVIFSYDLSNNISTDEYLFDGIHGASPGQNLIQGIDGKLYGVTIGGGQKGYGVIFNFNPNNSTYTDLHDFNDTTGSSPYGGLVQASNGKLYGIAGNGVVNQGGVIFSFDPSTNSYSDVYNFSINDGGVGSLIQANNGLLYGMTTNGGVYDWGTIFSFDPVSNSYSKLFDFNNNDQGASPYGSLFQANDDNLYGMTVGGGGGAAAVIFSFDPTSNNYNVLYKFGSSKLDSLGISPYGNLIQGSNGLLYGMTSTGGVNGWGVIFSFNPIDSIYNDLYNFDGKIGGNPYGSLMQAKDSKLYGTSLWGGDQFDGGYGGVVFSYDLINNIYQDLENLDPQTGWYSNGNLIEVNLTDIKQLSTDNNQLSIYPNPTSGQFTIKLNGNQNGYTVEIYNIVGEMVYQSVLINSQNIINLSSQPDGMYFVYLKSDEGVEVGKVMVTK